jgi:hypothetical protein
MTVLQQPFPRPSRGKMLWVHGVMISTVTTSTVSSITSVALIGTLSAITVVVLFALLVNKELVNTSDDMRVLRLKRALNIAIWPLIIAFLVIAAAKVIEIFS